jgi:hypothetical protein
VDILETLSRCRDRDPGGPPEDSECSRSWIPTVAKMTILKENSAARNQSDRAKAFIRLLRNNGLAGSMERVASASDDTVVDVTN